MNIGAKKRWDWINGFLTACLHSSLEDTGVSIDSNLNFKKFHDAYLKQFIENINSFSTLNALPSTVPDYAVRYIFQLEAELWGSNWRQYLNFYPDDSENYEPLETFKLAHAFFLLERCLDLFVQGNQQNYSRGKFRKLLFGKEDGLFSKYPGLLEALGPPFFLIANTQRVDCVSNTAEQRWKRLRNKNIPPGLKNFYRQVTGKQHFVDVIEASFINTRKTHLPHHFGRKGKNRKYLPKNTRAYWYDVLWNYSESIRYNPISPNKLVESNPFYWNRSIRWFTSITVTALLTLIAQRDKRIQDIWKDTYDNSSILRNVFDMDRFK